MLVWFLVAVPQAFGEPSETPQAQVDTGKSGPVYENYDPEKALANRAAPSSKHSEFEPPGPSFYLLAGVLFVAAVLGFRKLFQYLSGSGPWNATRRKVEELLPGLLEHGPAFRDFFETLNSSADALVPIETPKPALSSSAGQQPPAGPDFFIQAPNILPGLRAKLAEVSGSVDDAVRLRLLYQVRTELLACNADSAAPVMQPAWQLISALDGLLVQVLKRATNINHSVLRTVGGALEMLDRLTARSTAERLAAAPPARFLAVDDDPTSLQAISFALRKVLPAPDLAENGEAALELAGKRTYDVIFLDIEMPRMDGFEACSRIRKLRLNHTTPVVFVTSHADFDSRAKSFLSGAEDLIAKPYLTFEIAVKAITFVFLARLAAGGKTMAPVAAPNKVDTLQPNPPATSAVNPVHPAAAVVSGPPGVVSFADEFAATFFAATRAHLPTLRSQLKEVAAAREQAVRQEHISNLYLGARALTADAEQAELRSLVRYCSVLQAFFRKLLESPDAFAPHLIEMADFAFDVLESLARLRLNPNLHAPPLNILVVDDDAVCRRAYSGALQLAFQQPHLADSGDAAIALAEQIPFDAIFMDVRMPGMDGFAACAKIHQIPLNAPAPVVFVTSQSDLKSRYEAASSGGCGFIPKPALAVEITLTALALALQRRITMAQGPVAQEQSTPATATAPR